MVSDSISFPDIENALCRVARGERATTSSLQAAPLMRFWLWGCDANEVCDRGVCDFHLMHLTGMVCVRVFTEAYQHTSDALDAAPIIIDVADIEMLIAECGIFLPHFYTEKPQNGQGGVSIPSHVSLQQLRDLVQAIQTQWPVLQGAIEKGDCPVQKNMMLQTIDRLVTQLFIWFGTFLFASNLELWQADDTDFIDDALPARKLSLTDMGIKFYLNIFFVLFRLLFLQRHAVVVPVHTDPIQPAVDTVSTGNSCIDRIDPFDIESFHVEAGIDDFHMLGMYFDIPAGCLLEYKHSYSGYYNNVSQCVYRHFPSYKRRFPMSLDDILPRDAPGLSVLPALKQIYPEIGFAFEDHHFEKTVSSIRTAVLLSHARPQHVPPSTTKLAGNNPNNPKLPGVTALPTIRSEKLLARVAACRHTATGDGGSGTEGIEGGGSVRTTSWFWFVIGGNVYLVSTEAGVAYKGGCRDLLTFYLSTIGRTM